MKNHQDALIDQIIAELEEIAQCYWRMKTCCKMLKPKNRDKLHKEFFDNFLANAPHNRGQGSLSRIRTMVLSWRSKEPDPRNTARALFSASYSKRVKRMTDTGESTSHQDSRGRQRRVCSMCEASPTSHCLNHDANGWIAKRENLSNTPNLKIEKLHLTKHSKEELNAHVPNLEKSHEPP
jgi:hypothetical protein